MLYYIVLCDVYQPTNQSINQLIDPTSFQTLSNIMEFTVVCPLLRTKHHIPYTIYHIPYTAISRFALVIVSVTVTVIGITIYSRISREG